MLHQSKCLSSPSSSDPDLYHPHRIERSTSETEKQNKNLISGFSGPSSCRVDFPTSFFTTCVDFAGILARMLLWISLWIFCPSFEGTEGPKKSAEKNHTKSTTKSWVWYSLVVACCCWLCVPNIVNVFTNVNAREDLGEFIGLSSAEV